MSSVITAGTTRTQAGATQINADVTTVNTSTAPSAGSMLGDGVALPQVGTGVDRIWLINNTANPIQVYSFNGSGDTINGVAGSTGIPVAPNSAVEFIEAKPGAWSVLGTAMGYSAGFATETALNGITAHAGGGQSSATPLPASINRVTTVASANDSVLLPASAPGMILTVVNATATNAMAVFPAGTDAINALSASTAFSVAAGKTATFYCTNAGQWHSILSA
ncbi:conserved protein of unknown function [Pararobbsia alpina]|uniref:hypothetical protein n=1 Tax=Pararobbsia alpina TaxID=621374 RepID=UPI0039A6AEE1